MRLRKTPQPAGRVQRLPAEQPVVGERRVDRALQQTVAIGAAENRRQVGEITAVSGGRAARRRVVGGVRSSAAPPLARRKPSACARPACSSSAGKFSARAL